jgi:hypothetical protein
MTTRREIVEEYLSGAEAAFRLAVRDLDLERERSTAGGTRNAYSRAAAIVHHRMHIFLADQRADIVVIEPDSRACEACGSDLVDGPGCDRCGERYEEES